MYHAVVNKPFLPKIFVIWCKMKDFNSEAFVKIFNSTVYVHVLCAPLHMHNTDIHLSVAVELNCLCMSEIADSFSSASLNRSFSISLLTSLSSPSSSATRPCSWTLSRDT